MNILITGANGFLGKEFVEYFSDKEEHVLFLTYRYSLDVLDREMLEFFIRQNKIDIILHCAVSGKYGHSDFRDLSKNLTMFNNLSSLRGLYQFLFNFGSGAEFDKDKTISYNSERQIFNCMPREYYSLAKNLITREIYSVNHNIYNLRLFGCFGKHEESTRFIKNTIEKMKRGQDVVLKENPYFDFFYAKDVCRVIEYISNRGFYQKDINLVYEHKINLWELACRIKKIMKSDSTIRYTPKFAEKDYVGSQMILNSLNLNLIGLENGLREVING